MHNTTEIEAPTYYGAGGDSMEEPIGLTVTKNLDGDPLFAGIYGKEVVLDCYGCDISKFNRKDLRTFFKQLVDLLDMERGPLYFWDDVGVPEDEKQTRPETKGTTAVQFIVTSNITIHTLDLLERVYLNIFSCKGYSTGEARTFVQEWFDAKFVRTHVLMRS